MVEDASDDFLRDVQVDQPGAQGMTILMGRDMDWSAVRVANGAAAQPFCERVLVAGVAGAFAAVGVGPRPREQHWCSVGPAVLDSLPLLDDLGFEFVVDGD